MITQGVLLQNALPISKGFIMAPRFIPPPGPGCPLFFSTPEEMQVKIQEYFDSLINVPVMVPDGEGGMIHTVDPYTKLPVYKNLNPLVTGLAMHLGFADVQSLSDYEKRPAFSGLVKAAKNYIFSHHENRMSTGENCTGSIFWAKNQGWTDKSESVVNNNHSGSIEQKKTIAFTFKDLPGHIVRVNPPSEDSPS
jgi:hypothetical protein